MASLYERNGTDLRYGVTVTGLAGDDLATGVQLADGSSLDADLAVVGIGATPATGWLAGSGLDVDNGMMCDETLACGVPGVYAAGGVASWTNPLFDVAIRLEHWTSAAEQGQHAARTALDPVNATAYRHVPYFWSDWYDDRIQFVGLPHGEP